MENPFGITKERVASTVKEMADLMGCDYKTAWKKYTHQLVKDCFSWEEIAPLLEERNEV